MDRQRVADSGGACVKHPLEVVLQRVRTVEVDPFGAVASQPQAGQQTRQSKDVVAMHVRYENAPQLREAQITAQKLMLRALAAVEEPHFCPLRQPHRHRRDIATPGRDA